MGRHVAVSAGVSGRAQDADSWEPDPRRQAEGQDRPIEAGSFPDKDL